MQTIKNIQDQIQKTQDRIDAENRAAQTERDRAEQFRMAEDIPGAQAHANTAARHEQTALQLQGEITNLMAEQERLQTELANLDQQKNDVAASKDSELSQIDTQIEKLRGGA